MNKKEDVLLTVALNKLTKNELKLLMQTMNNFGENCFNAGKYLGFGEAHKRPGSYSNYEEWITQQENLIKEIQ